jgi:hypothetical protein
MAEAAVVVVQVALLVPLKGAVGAVAEKMVAALPGQAQQTETGVPVVEDKLTPALQDRMEMEEVEVEAALLEPRVATVAQEEGVAEQQQWMEKPEITSETEVEVLVLVLQDLRMLVEASALPGE